MEWLISFSVRRRGAVALFGVVALVLAAWGAWNCPLDVFPEFVPSRVTVHTDAPGFTAEQVEQLVTHPLEKSIGGAEGVVALRSESIPELSVITVNFANTANLFNSRQDVFARLAAETGKLPAGTAAPELSPLTSSTRALLKVGLGSETLDAYALRDIADYVIKPRLVALPGVAEVDVFGGATREIDIEPDPRKLAAYGFSVADIVKAAPGALALKGAGFIDLKGQRVLIKTPTPSPDSSIIGDGILGIRGETPVHLRDVATIAEGSAQRIGDALIQGKPGVLLSVSSQYGANTLATTRAVEHVLTGLAASLSRQGVALYPALHQPANFIEKALTNLVRNLGVAAGLILLSLVLFLRDWRSAMIAFITIPLSLLAAVAVLNYFGLTLNTMTLSGFVVSLGVLIDDAVIAIENILRRLRENSQKSVQLRRTDVIRGAALEVHGPVFYATLVVLAVFVPELLSSNVQGRLIGPLAMAFMLAVVVSFVVALTVTPALSAIFLFPEDAHVDPLWIRGLKKLQGLAIEANFHFIYVSIAVVTLATAAAISVLPLLGRTFLPEFREGHLVVEVDSKVPGTSIGEMLSLGKSISREVLSLPYVSTIEQQIGRSKDTGDTWGPHQSEFQIELRPDVDVDQAKAESDIRAILAHYRGVQSSVVTFLGDRISESLTGQTSQVAVKISGPDLALLDGTAQQVATALGGVPGIVDLEFKREDHMPMLRVELDPTALAALGLRGQDVLDTIATDYAGTEVGEAYSGARTVDVVVRLPQAWRRSPEQLNSLILNGPFGLVPVSSVARVVPDGGRYRIRHENGERFDNVTFNVAGRSLQSVASEVEDRIAKVVPADPRIHIELTGAPAAERQTRFELALYSALVLAGIALVLLLSFRWPANPLLVMANLPFSLIGSALAIWATGTSLSLGVLVGLATVFGVSARNAILLLSYYEAIVESDGLSWSEQVVIRGANERLTPILMTAVLTGLGLATLAYSMNQPGFEISGPMAVTILGGLASSTLLNLFLLPALAARFAGPRTSGETA